MNTHHLRRYLLLSSFVMLPFPAYAYTGSSPRITHVGTSCGAETCDFSSIQAAIDDGTLSVGDEIYVYPGTYNENVVIDSGDPEVKILRAPLASGGDVTLNGGGVNPALQVTGGQTEGLVIQGIKLTNGRGLDVAGDGKYYGGGVYIKDSSPTLEDLYVTGNTATFGGGLYLIRSNPALRNVTVESNTVVSVSGASSGAGMYLHTDSSPTIDNSIVRANSGALRGGGIYMYAGCAPSLLSVKIMNNSADYGGGLYLSSGAAPVFEGALIVENSAWATTTATTPPGGGGVYLYDGAQPLFINTTLASNITDPSINDGTEIYSYGGNARLRNSIVYGSDASKTLLYGLDFSSGAARPAGLELRYTDVCNWDSTDCTTNPIYGGAYSEVTVASGPMLDTDGTSFLTQKALTNAPGFVLPGLSDYRLNGGSLLVNAGDPEEKYNDVDGTRSDLGAYGGPFGVNDSIDYWQDSDYDLMQDQWEQTYFSGLSRDGTADYDSDGLIDSDEFYYGTDPIRSDSDLDGYYDATEISNGSDPRDAGDHRPVAVAGRDRVALTGEVVSLDGGRSSDPDGASLTYAWSIVRQPGADSLSASSGATTTITPSAAGIYVIRLTVTDAVVSPADAAASSSKSVTLYVGSASTDEVLVPSEVATLQGAIDSVGSSQYATITADAGTYNENVDFGGKIIRVRSASGAASTTISASSGSVVSFKTGEPAASSLEGFTLTGGLGTSVGGALTGGGVYIEGASPTLTSVIVSGNSATYGGGIAILGGQPYFDQVTVSSNTIASSGYGAGVYAYGSDVEFLSSALSGNTASGGVAGSILGGGMFAYGSRIDFTGTASVRGAVNTNKAASGAGLYFQYCPAVRLSKVDISANTASSYGGGLYAYRHTKVSADDVAFTSNSVSGASGQGGAGMLNDYSVIDLKGSAIGQSGSGNSAVNGGGFALASYAAIQATGSNFLSNTASSNGGALYNGAKYLAGATQSKILSSSFRDNRATGGAGGAIFLTNSSRLTIDMDPALAPSELTGNSATTDGGAISVNSGDRVYVSHAIFQGNSAARGGAVYTYNAGKATLDSCTLVGNTATNTGSGVATVVDTTQNGTLVDISNSIITDSARGIAISGPSNISLAYSNLFNNIDGNLTGGVAAGTGVLYVAPGYTGFVDDSDFTNDNFRLISSSSCIDAGTPAGRDLGAYSGLAGEEQDAAAVTDADADGMADAWETAHGLNTALDDSAVDTDSDGLTNLEEYTAGTDPSLADTDGDGVSDGDEISANSDPVNAVDNRPVARAGADRAARLSASVTLDGSRSSDPNGDALSWAWSFVSVPAGSALVALTDHTTVRPSFIPDVAGDYVVGLTVSDGVATSPEDTVTLHVLGSVLTVGSAQAYTTIQSAIDAASDWSVILVQAGTYNENLTLGTRPLTVISESGSSSTIITGTGTGSVVTFSSSPETVVFTGFTVTGGSATSGGGIYLGGASARIEDCVIRNNSATRGGGIYAYNGSPAILASKIVNNTASSEDGGGVYLYYSTNALLMGNVIAKNQARYGGGVFAYYGSSRIHFNSIVGNKGTSGGGGMHLLGGTPDMRNNIVANGNGGGGVNVATGTATFEYNLVYGNSGYAVTGISMSGTNLTSDPKFNAYTTSISSSALLDDYRLKYGSPAFNSATRGLYGYQDPAGATDRDALTSNDQDPDMGAFGGPLADLTARTNAVKASVSGDEANTHYTSVASALSATFSGDTVQVYGGTYNERINFGGRDVTVIGSVDSVDSILDGGAGGSVVVFNTSETSAARLEGFVLQNGSGTTVNGRTYGGGIYISGASPTISRCILQSNQAQVGGGLFASSSVATIDNVQVLSNGFNSEGTVTTLYGGGIAVDSSDGLMITDAEVKFNKASELGGGIYVYSATAGTTSDLVNVLVQENSCTRYGGGVFGYNSDVNFQNSMLVGNEAGNNGGGGAWFNGGTMSIRNSIVADNYGQGVVIVDWTADANEVVEYSLFYQNWNTGLSTQYAHLRIFGNGTVDTSAGNLIPYSASLYDPQFTAYTRDGSAGTADDFHLLAGSPAIDAGNPGSAYNDPDASVNDMGIYGGADASLWDLL